MGLPFGAPLGTQRGHFLALEVPFWHLSGPLGTPWDLLSSESILLSSSFEQRSAQIPEQVLLRWPLVGARGVPVQGAPRPCGAFSGFCLALPPAGFEGA